MEITFFAVGRRWPDGRISDLIAGPFVTLEAARMSANAHRRAPTDFDSLHHALAPTPCEILEFRIEAELRGTVE